MSLGKLKRTLHREFTRNPAKSLTLLALLPVAGYFVGPVVWKQLPGSKENKPSGVAVATVDGAALATIAAASGPSPLPRWQDVAQWIDQDERMKSSVTAGLRDPFHPVKKIAETSDAERQTKEPTPSAASLRPEDCGLQLTATIIGSGKRLATISGRLYSENSRVRFRSSDRSPNDSPPDDDSFVLQTVAKNYVVLERHGELFQLPLVRSTE